MEKIINCIVLCTILSFVHSRVLPSFTDTDASTELRLGRSTVCYTHLGCFSNDGAFFDLLQRPLSPLPQSPSSILTTFSLYTRYSGEEILTSSSPDSIIHSHFNSSRKTKFIVHGFMDHSDASWIKNMISVLLQQGDYNVITVDWVVGAVTVYRQAASNARVVGAEIWYLCKKLTDLKGLRNEDVHIIGHSLGAHIAGYAGERMLSLGRISGLDPAEPYFQGTDPEVRLDPTDAQFVDVIHTDADHFALRAGIGGYGMRQPCGHVDFYPNGGTFQPGCSYKKAQEITDNDGVLVGLWHLATCNHVRSVSLYIESILSNTKFISFPCSDYKSFVAGKCACNDGCVPMGFYADTMDQRLRDRPNNFYFLKTGASLMYSRQHYIVTLKTKPTMTSVSGQIYMDIGGGLGNLTKVTDEGSDVEENQRYLLVSNSAVNPDTVFRLKWQPQSRWFGQWLWGQSDGSRTLDIEAVEIDGPGVKAEVLNDVIVEPDTVASAKLIVKT